MQEKDSLQPRRRAEEMEYLIQEQASGDLSVKQFCKEHRISEAVFYYWQKKCRHKNNVKGVGAGFKEIGVIGSIPASPGHVYAEYKGILFYQEPSVSLLKQLIG